MKTYKFNTLAIIVALFLLSCNSTKENEAGHNTEAYQKLKAGFLAPPREARPKGMWCWINGNFGLKEITHEIREAADKGMGGLDIWDAPPVTDFNNVVPTGPGYPSDEFMVGVKHANQEALKYGINLGFIWNQSVSYHDPENEIKVLESSEVLITQAGQQSITLPIPKADLGKRSRESLIEKDDNGNPKHYWDVAVLAFPVGEDSLQINQNQIVDLSDKLNKDNTLNWYVPKGNWKVVRYTSVNSGQGGLTPTPATLKPALDFLDPDATRTHLSYLMDIMKKHVGQLGESAITHFYSDSYEFRGHKWTVEFPQFFNEAYNYNIIDFLPAIFGYQINSTDSTRRFMADYNNLVSDLTIDNHYKVCAEVAKQYGVNFAAEAAGPGYPVHHVPFESLRACGALDFVRGEFWHQTTENKPTDRSELLQIIKGPASSAHIYNQTIVEAESFTGTDMWQEGPNELKPSVDRFFCEGLNRIAFHTFPHTPKRAGLPGWVYGFGTQISENLPWWPKAKPFMTYLGRCGFMLQQGNFVGDMLYFYGDTAPNFVPGKNIDTIALKGYDYDYINSEVLINKLEVKDGKLVLPHGQSYEVLILPKKDAIALTSLQKIEQLAQAGAWIVGPKPRQSYSLSAKQDDEAIQKLANKIWNSCNGQSKKQTTYGKGKIFWNIPVKEVLQKKGIVPDFNYTTHNKCKDIDYIHRRVNGIDLYFIANQNNERLYLDAHFRVSGKTPEIWEPVSGEMFDLPLFTGDEQTTQVPLVLEPYGSCFVVFSKPSDNKHFTTLIKNDRQIFPINQSADLCFRFSKQGEFIFEQAGKYQLKGQESEQTIESEGIQENIPLNEDWQLSFTDPWGESFEAAFKNLHSWTKDSNPKIKFFSGQATYTKTFSISEASISPAKKVFLNFEGIEEIAHVYLNGQDLGILWTKPYKLNISQAIKTGENKLSIEVVNNWANILCGEARKPEAERRYHSNISKMPSGWHTPFEEIPKEGAPLIDAGVWGLNISIY